MAVPEKAQIINQMKGFFQEVAAEKNKIVWPTRELLTQSTTTVMIIIVVLSVYLGAADILLRFLFKFIE